MGSVLFKARHDWLHVVMEEWRCDGHAHSAAAPTLGLMNRNVKTKIQIPLSSSYDTHVTTKVVQPRGELPFQVETYVVNVHKYINLRSCLHSVAKKH